MFNIQREGKKEMLEEEIGSEGEAKLDMVHDCKYNHVHIQSG